jgi:hypothetical protein
MNERPLSEKIKVQFARSVGKNGDFFLVSEEMEAIAGELSNSDVVALYVYIRDHSMRLEAEWRNEFIANFPRQASLLPDPTT